MRAPLSRSITAAVLTLTSVVSWSAPAWALRSANKTEAKAGAEDVRLALVSDVPTSAAISPAPTVRPSTSSGRTVGATSRPAAAGAEEKTVVVSPIPLQPKESKALSQRAGHAVSVAFSEGRAFSVPSITKAADPKQIGQFVEQWAAARAKRELEPVLPAEKKQAEQDLAAAVALIRDVLDALEPGGVTPALQGARYAFILESSLKNLEETQFVEKVMGFRPKVHTYYGSAAPSLYEEGQSGTDSHHSVVALAGTYPYDVEGKPASIPNTLYLSVAHLKRIAQLVKERPADAQKIRQTLALYLRHLKDQLILAGGQYPNPSGQGGTLTSTVPPTFNADLLDLEKQVAALWQQDLAVQRKAWADKDAKRVTETFVSVKLSNVFGPISQIPEAVSKAAEMVLEAAKGAEIKDFIVQRIGDYLLFDVSHQKPANNLEIRTLIGNAVIEAIRQGQATLGTGVSVVTFDWNALDWHEAHWRYTERSSQPTLRQVIVGGSQKAADGILFDLYASPNITTQQAIEGTHGTFFFVENTDDPSKRLGFTLPGGETNKGLFEMLAVAKTSNHAIRAVFTGKGGRAPVDEPAAATFSLGGLQLAVYNSQAGWEAIGGITGPGTAPRIIDGSDRRLSLKPVTWEQAVTLNSAKLAGELAGYAPSIWWGSQMFNNGEFDQLTDPIKGPEFSSTQLNEIRDEFARVLLGQGEAQPFLKTEEADARALAAYRRFMARENKRAKELETGTLTTGVFKADIGSYLGHTGPLDVFMATTRAVLEEAKQSGLIVDYLVKHTGKSSAIQVTEFRAGDDIELHVVHHRPIGDPEIHKLAWRAFWAAGWAADVVLKRKPYGLMQDLPNAKNLDAWMEAAMTPATRDLILKNLRTLSQRDPRAIDAAELKKVETEWDSEYTAQQAGTRQKKVISSKAIGFTGNVKGSGIGSAEGYITPGAWSILAYDKASPGVFSVPFMWAAEAALAAGVYTNALFELEKVRPEYDANGKEIPQEPIILDYADLEDRREIQRMLGAVNEFQIKAIRTKKADGMIRLVAVNSTDRLYQVTAGVYAGKDDPVSILDSEFASFVFQWMQKELFITEGDERGSHWAFVLPVPMDRSSPGTHSIPIAVGLNFTITQNGTVEGVEDVFDAPAFEPIRSKAAYYNWAFIRAVGNLAPRGDAASVEATYPLHLNLAKITALNSPYSLPPPVAAQPAAGVEETTEGFVATAPLPGRQAGVVSPVRIIAKNMNLLEILRQGTRLFSAGEGIPYEVDSVETSKGRVWVSAHTTDFRPVPGTDSHQRRFSSDNLIGYEYQDPVPAGAEEIHVLSVMLAGRWWANPNLRGNIRYEDLTGALYPADAALTDPRREISTDQVRTFLAGQDNRYLWFGPNLGNQPQPVYLDEFKGDPGAAFTALHLERLKQLVQAAAGVEETQANLSLDQVMGRLGKEQPWSLALYEMRGGQETLRHVIDEVQHSDVPAAFSGTVDRRWEEALRKGEIVFDLTFSDVPAAPFPQAASIPQDRRHAKVFAHAPALAAPSAAGAEQAPAEFLADVFERISALMKRFQKFSGLSFDPAVSDLTGTVVDLSASPEQAIAALYLPKGTVVLVQQDALVKAMQLTGRGPEGLALIYVENDEDFFVKVGQAIEFFDDVMRTTVRVLSTRPTEWVRAEVNRGWGRGIDVQVEGGLTLQQLLKNAGAVWNGAADTFLGLVRDAEGLLRFL